MIVKKLVNDVEACASVRLNFLVNSAVSLCFPVFLLFMVANGHFLVYPVVLIESYFLFIDGILHFINSL